MAFNSNFVWSTNLLKNSLEVIHTFIDYSEWPSKYSPLEDNCQNCEELSVSVVCGNPSWKLPFIYCPNHLLQFGENSNWLLIILQFLVPRKRNGCLIYMLKSKISGIKSSITFSFLYFHIIMIEDLTAIMK